MNFADILDVAAARSPHAEAVRLDGDAFTYAALRDQAQHAAGLVLAARLSPGATVAVLMHNALEYAEIAFGIMGAGHVLLPVNPRLAPPEVSYIVNDADVEMIFVGPEFVDMVEGIRGALPRVAQVVVVARETPPHLGWRTYAEALDEAATLEQWADTADADDCMLVYTSGTTGNPKGAVRSHSSALWGASNFSSVWGDFSPERDRFLYAIPLASIGFLNVFGSCLLNGLTVDLVHKFVPGDALALIAARRITHAYLVPAMWRAVMRSSGVDRFDTSSLRVGVWGGEPLDDALRARIIARFGSILVGVFGTTEGALLSARPGDDDRYPKTSGRAAGYNIFKIVDADGAEVPRGTVGELINKSPTTLSRYYKNESATREVLRGGWYFTGDLAWMTDDGFVFVVDRKREMLITGGQNVYPAELERALCAHPAVAAAAVIGVPDEQWGETAMAFVVLEDDQVGPKELSEHMRSNLASYKVPRHWRIVSELPTNSMGKVRKHALRQMGRQG